MAKLNYGPRFGNNVASASYEYNEAQDVQDRAHRQQTAAKSRAMKDAPLHKRELWNYQNSQRGKKRYEPNNELKREREAAEERMAEVVRQAVAMLEFNLTVLSQIPKISSNYKAAVNPLAVTNAIITLRTRCGVHFDDPGELKRVSIDDCLRSAEPKTEEQQQIDKDFLEMTSAVQQKERRRLERIKLMKIAKAKLNGARKLASK